MSAAPDGIVLQACALGLRLQGQRIVDQVSLPVQRHEHLQDRARVGVHQVGRGRALGLALDVVREHFQAVRDVLCCLRPRAGGRDEAG